MSRRRVYVGTYTNSGAGGIHLLEFDQASGRFESGPVLATAAEHPSFLALHPNGRVLYAVNELKTFRGAPAGAVSAFEIDEANGQLALLNQQPSGGTDPCHLAVDSSGRNLLVANYTSGTLALLRLSADGSLRPPAIIRRRTGAGPIAGRQDGPHAHMVLLDAAERFALWTDLGTDRVVVDRFDGDAGTLQPNQPDSVGVEPGAGPRHVAWHPSGRVLYLLNELSATVVAFTFDGIRGVLHPFQRLPARSDASSGENTAAGLAVSPDGRFVYASNRGDNDIAVFGVDAATLGLSAVGRVPAGGRVPRHIAIDPSGQWLIASNQASSALVVFRLDPETGLPTVTGETLAVPEPVCVLFAGERRTA